MNNRKSSESEGGDEPAAAERGMSEEAKVLSRASGYDVERQAL